MATVTQKLLTAEEFARLPAPTDGSRQELVRGEIVSMPPPRFRHSEVVGRVYSIIDQHVRPARLGRVVPETGVRTERGPDSVRGPDVAYWSAEKLPFGTVPDVYPQVSPDLCVEVLSPDETPRKVREKLEEYFESGIRMVWIVDPDERTVTIHRNALEGRILLENATLDGEDVLPSFSCVVKEFFA